jgi:large subunit ribosomal protein L21
MYAVIRSGGKQYRVAPGQEISLERLPAASNAQVEFTDVLAVAPEGGELRAGSAIQAVKVHATVLAEQKGAKVLVFHYKRKKQYKKLAGHRQKLTRVRIDSISGV